MRILNTDLSRNLRRLRAGAVIGAMAFPLAGCDIDEVLTVEDPAVATPASLETAAAVPTVYAGAVGDFQVAWSGNGLSDAFVPVVGLFSDEFRSSDTFTTRNDADRRTQASPSSGNLADIPYVALHRARRSTFVGATLVSKFSAATDPRIAELRSLNGYTFLAFGEAFCSGVPFAPEATAEQFIEGAPLTTAQMFDSAASRFRAAIAGLDTATDAAAVSRRNLARVGLARTLLNQAKYAEAATTVAAVPLGFVYKNQHSSNSNRQQNSLFNLNGSNRRYTVADVEGTNGLNYRSANDPRIPWTRPFNTATPPALQVGFDNATPLYEQLLYSTPDADVPVADGVEARLIIAEAILNAGGTTWIDTLNVMRQNYASIQAARFDNFALVSAGDSVTATSLAPLTDPGTQAARIDLLFRERAFWLYATGHRLGDLRRLVRHYGRAVNSVYPTGAWHKGGVYGSDVNLVVGFDEENNSLFRRADCVTATP